MKTKLVYVLTCAPEKYYIEQALMSIWSARHWNPDAHIILIVDDQTEKLFVGKRAEVLDYISEKIVVPFVEEISMMIRSRWIKTKVRNLINGDYLFIDCDTIITWSLSEIDTFSCSVCAVLDSMIPVSEYCESLYKATYEQTQMISVDFSEETEYFNSGVMYVKDVPEAHHLYNLWHQYWEEGVAKNLFIDQPALAKANRETGRMIQKLANHYNFMLWTQANEPEKAYILHISSYRNPNFLFVTPMLDLVKSKGLTEWVKYCMLNPCDCMFPFNYSVLHSTFGKRLRWVKSIANTASAINRNLPELIDDFPMQSSFRGTVLWMFHHDRYRMGAMIWMLWKRLQVLRKRGLKDNCCRK